MRAELHTSHREASQAYEQGRAADALTLLDQRFTTATMPHATVLLKARCLLEMKQPDAACAWLTTACTEGVLEDADLSADVVRLNAALYHGDLAHIQVQAETLLLTCDNPADRNHAELRLILSAALRGLGQVNEAMGHAKFACSAFTVLAEPGRCAVAANFLGWTCLSLGQLNAARRWFEKSLGLNTRAKATFRVAQNYQNLAIVCYKQGDYQLAKELLTKELELASDHADMTCRALIALGNVRRLQGQYQTARTALLKAYSLAKQEKMRREEVLALEFLGDVLRDEGQPDAARQYYRRGLVIARELAPRGDLVVELTRRRGECLDIAGHPRAAEQVLHTALEMSRQIGDAFETAVTLRCLGVNAARLGRWQQARKHLRRAIAELQESCARYETMVAEHELSRLLARHGDPSLNQAWQHGLRAQQLNHELESPVLAREIANHLADLARRRLGCGEAHTTSGDRFSSQYALASRVIAVSTEMQETLRRCDGFSRYQAPVLLNGEIGTGKELLARRIHENSARSARPWVHFNCVDTPTDEQTRTLFGRHGMIDQAQGGTLLFTGIEALAYPLQVRLLNLIQAAEPNHDVRVIATSTADLDRLAEQRRFRSDLYFRLRVMSVQVPALRQRTADIVPMMDFFLSRLEGSTLTTHTLLDLPALEILTQYRWPGNADELEDLAQRAWLKRDLGQTLHLTQRRTSGGHRLVFDDGGAAAGHPSGMTHAGLTALIVRSQGNKARVARNLGISRVTLYRWLRQLGASGAT